MSTVKARVMFTTLTALLLLSACGKEAPEIAEGTIPPLKARVAAAQAVIEAKTIETIGTVQPARQAVVSSRIMGPVVSVEVWAGATVRKGQEMIKIQPETSEGQVSQAEGALAQAQAALALSERNLKRYKALHAEKAVSDAELDVARMQYQQALGAVEQAQGAVQSARSVADDAQVEAPFDARVVEHLVEVGDMAAPGRPLVRLESLEGQRIWLTVREADRHRIEVGQQLPVRLDSRPDLGVIAGTVAEIVPNADPATHTFVAKVDLGNADVASGVSGRAEIPGDPIERIVIPTSAVHQRGGLELVIVHADDGTARTRAVRTGAFVDADRVEVLSGIKAGESVVVDAHSPVADGTPLEVQS